MFPMQLGIWPIKLFCCRFIYIRLWIWHKHSGISPYMDAFCPFKYCSYFREQIWLVIVEFNRLFEMSSDFRKVNSEKSGKYCKPKEERLRPTTFLLESHVI